MGRHRMPAHSSFTRVASKLLHHESPCMSEADDWETSSSFLAEEHLVKQRQTTPDRQLERTLALQHGAEGLCGGQGPMQGHGSRAWGGGAPQPRPSSHLTRRPARPADDAAMSTVLRTDGITSLRRAWESSQRSTKEDWAEWMRNFSIELLKQSPSRALRACATLAQTNPGMARELFAAGFVSCWSELDDLMKEQLVRSLEAALASPTIPPDIVTTLLNLAEFMEHDEKKLPLETRCVRFLA